DHAAQAEHRLGPRPVKAVARCKLLDGGKEGRECALIDADLAGARIGLEGKGRRDVPARQRLAAQFPNCRLEALVALRQTQAHIEAAPVDAAQLPMKPESVRGAVGAGKSCHAAQRHRSSMSLPQWAGEQRM